MQSNADLLHYQKHCNLPTVSRLLPDYVICDWQHMPWNDALSFFSIWSEQVK